MQPDQLLGRVLRREVDVSALLGYLASLDPDPLRGLLDLHTAITEVRVEVPYTESSRMDVVLYGGVDDPIAVIEVKVSATEHGDQLRRYEAFAAEHGAKKVLVDLELAGTRTPKGWIHQGLAEVFGAWAGSADPVAQHLGPAIAEVFQRWAHTATDVLARIDSAMYPVVLRMLRDDLATEGFEAYAGGTAKGQPSLTVFKPHPSRTERAFLCVDIRCQNKNRPDKPWLLRLGLQIDAGPDLVDDRLTANHLAMKLAPSLTFEQVEAKISRSSELAPLVNAVQGANPLKRPRDLEGAIVSWLESVETIGDGAAPRHPVFHADWGRRLAAQFTIDPSLITPADLKWLIVTTMQYLLSAAAQADQRRTG